MEDPFLRDQISEGPGGGGNAWGGMRGLRGVRAPIRGAVRMSNRDPLLYSMMGLLPTPGMNQQGFNPFRPMMPNWGNGGYWDQQNARGHELGMAYSQQAPKLRMIEALLGQGGLLGPGGAMSSFLRQMGGGMQGGAGGMMGMQSVNSPQGFSLGPLLQQMAR